MKRIGILLGIGCAVVILAVGIYFSITPRTLDFRGVVTEIEQTGERTVFHIEYVEHTQVVAADADTHVYREEDKNDTLSPQAIRVGDTIEGDYRWRTKDNAAKFIRVWE